MKTSLLYNIISVNYIDKIKAKLLKEDSDIKQTYLEKKQKLTYNKISAACGIPRRWRFNFS